MILWADTQSWRETWAEKWEFIFKIIKCIVYKWPRNGETCHYYKKPKYFEISFCWWSNPRKPMNGWRFKKFLQILHFYVSWRWPWIWICYIYSHKGALLKLKYFIFGASNIWSVFACNPESLDLLTDFFRLFMNQKNQSFLLYFMALAEPD